VWWHGALFHFEQAQYDKVLRLYDTRFRAELSEDYLDISNAVAMLWRLENIGVSVGERWAELADKAEARTGDHLLAFADLHFAVALGAAGRRAELDEMIESMLAAVRGGGARTTQEQVLASVAATFAQGIRAFYLEDYDLALGLMRPLLGRLRAIGGSHAQRDLFQQMVIAAAMNCERFALARALLHERTALKPASAHAWNLLARALDGEGKARDADAARRQADALLAA
jgi:hypothetical protein